MFILWRSKSENMGDSKDICLSRKELSIVESILSEISGERI
jgi:hypothetical protein